MIRSGRRQFANHRLWGLLCLLLSINFVSAAFAQDFLTREERNWLKAHPIIKVAPDPDYPPFDFFDKKGNFLGITADYLHLAEKKLGIKFQIVRHENWHATLDDIKARKVDVIGTIAVIPERQEFLLFTKTHIQVPLVIITRKSVEKDLSLNDLNGMRVAVVSGHAVYDFIARDYPAIKLDSVSTIGTGLKKVSFGMADAFIVNLGSATYYIEEADITNLRVAGETGYFYDLAFGIRKDWPVLQSILDKAIDQIPQDQRQAIFQKWVHLQQRPLISNHQLLIGVAGGIGAFMLILGGVLIWNRSLRAMVRLRTTELRQELSERQRAEAEVRSLNLELEDRVARRTAELAEVNKELEAFSYSVSHDLRTPLRSLDGFSQLLIDAYSRQMDEQGQDYLQRIRSASQRMAQLIDDMLKLSRISRNEMNPAPVDLSLLAELIAEELRVSQPDRRVDFVIEQGVTATADQNLMGIVLRNLLGNAWKFTGKVPQALIEFGTCVIDGENVFFVRDNGAGFDMEYAKKLFQPFQRLHGDSEFEGTGIGLATVQRVIRRHGGRIWAEAKVNEGATFYFTLPG